MKEREGPSKNTIDIAKNLAIPYTYHCTYKYLYTSNPMNEYYLLSINCGKKLIVSA